MKQNEIQQKLDISIYIKNLFLVNTQIASLHIT